VVSGWLRLRWAAAAVDGGGWGHDGWVPYAVVLLLDGHAERRVSALWAALDRRGVVSAATLHGDDRPHVTLNVFDDCVAALGTRT
jgi:hypothetical protein